jgi:hypothetical protein
MAPPQALRNFPVAARFFHSRGNDHAHVGLLINVVQQNTLEPN